MLGIVVRALAAASPALCSEVVLDVIKTADWVIDLGPEGGDGGGQIVAQGTPETIAAHPTSFTGHYLRKALTSTRSQSARTAAA